ncbi:MAG: S8 family peptidase [Saprospiraceae bacterium]|nr:S8 family peptidase [Saprospiraceae bacterium]
MNLKYLFFTIIICSSFIFGYSQTINPDFHDGKVFFKLNDNVPNLTVNEEAVVEFNERLFFYNALREFNITKIYRPFDFNNDPKLLRTYKIEFSDFENIDLLVEKLSQIAEFEYIEKVPLDRIEFVPNDTLYNTTALNGNWNWHLDKINAELAWDISKGSSSIKVAVVDNAIWIDHPDLVGKIVATKDVANYDSDPNPPAVTANAEKFEWSHGTHCAGLVGAKSDNNIGIASIGYNVSIMAIKATKNSGDPEITTHSMEGVQWAVDNGADVISLSLGSSQYSATYDNYYTSIVNAGVVVVASAGNEGIGDIRYPAGYNKVIAVGSTNFDDKRSSFSQYGYWLDVSAPGGYYPNESTPARRAVISTTFSDAIYAYGIPVFRYQKYDLMQGTSMSCPIVAGLCGLILSANPTLNAYGVKNCLKWGCDNIDSKNSSTYAGKMGAGRINALASLQCASYVGIEEADIKNDFIVYPNPANIEFTIKSDNLNSFKKIEIYNSLGVLVKVIEIAKSNSSKLNVNVFDIPNGVYFISMKSPDLVVTHKLLINRD